MDGTRPEDSGPERVGPYRIEDELGVGGMGAVYRAWDERLRRPVAIKRVLPEVDDPLLRDRFRREAQAAASLNHPSIVHIYDIVEGDKGDWIVMELVEGTRLDLLMSRGPVGVSDALRLGREIARGLAEAHAKAIVHRDLKAENVMVTREGHAKILDFGLAKLAQEVSDDYSTQGTVLGTARAMSPEHAMGLGVDQRSDLFSLGTLLYEAFAGSSPFRADAVVETLRRVCTFRQAPVSSVRGEVPEALSQLIDRLLEKDPARRPRSAREVIAALVRISEVYSPESMNEAPSRAARRHESGRPEASRERSDNRRAAGGGDREAQGDSTTARHRPLAPRGRTGSSPAVEGSGRTPDGQRASSPHRSPPVEEGTVSGSLARTCKLEPTVRHLTRFRQFGERRQVTVSCFELLGARRGAPYGVLEPEVLYDVMPELLRLAGESIERFEGHLGPVLGHRLWAYFGYPRAHEDDAERAVRAALELASRLRQLDFPTLDDPAPGDAAPGRLALRAGLHTGQAVVTPQRSSDVDIALGSTLELAESIRQLAEPDTVAVSRETHRLIAASFVTEAVEPAEGAKDLGVSGKVYRILELRDARSRLEGSASLLPLVDRERELERLVELWSRVRKGTGQVVFVSGEPGIGKTRLVRALNDLLAADRPPWWIAVGSTFTRDSPLHPVVELLRSLIDAPVEGSDPRGPDEAARGSALDRLEEMLGAHRFSLSETVPLFAGLLRLPLEGRYEPLRSTPARQRARTLEAFNALLLEKAEREPAVMVVEDLQWVDPSTLELLDLLLDQVPAAPLLLILTFRPDFELPWAPDNDVVHLRLEPFGDTLARQLVEHVTGNHPLPAAMRERIVLRADGVPLFLEEMTKSVLEIDLGSSSGEEDFVTPTSELAIPSTLRASLTARLDLLKSAKSLVELAAVVGREFSYDLLRSVSGLDRKTLDEELERVLQAGLVLRAPSRSRERRYVFKNVMIQEIAYRSLLKRRRQELHLEVARVLESAGGAAGAAPPEVLARHYTRGRLAEKAAACWLAAGRRALERSANVEAIDHLQNGLAVLGALTPGEERARMELELECALIPALIAVEGYTAKEVRQVMARAYELCGDVGDPRLFWAIWATWAHYLLRGDTARAGDLAFQLLRLAESGEVPRDPGTSRESLELHARHAVGFTLYERGELESAREHLERAVALDKPGRDLSDVYRSGQEVGLTARSVLGLTLWHLGRPDRALEESDEALAAARKLDHPYSLAFALATNAWLLLYRGDHQALLARSMELTAHCRKQGLWLSVFAGFFLECARTEIRLRDAGEAPAGGSELVEGLEKALQAVIASGVNLALTSGLCHTAELSARLGRWSECRGFLERAAALQDGDGGGNWAPELDRIRGRLALSDAEPSEGSRRAEACFERALAAARAQGDRSLALRAATDLADLRRRQGRGEEARALLATVLEDVDGGRETRDWRAARAVLDARR